MKKIVLICVLMLSGLLYAHAQRVVYQTTGYAEKSGGTWKSEVSSNISITVDTKDSFIEISSGDPMIFNISKTLPTKDVNGKQVTEYICSDNEAMECKIQMVKDGGSTKLYVIYPDSEYYYTLK